MSINLTKNLRITTMRAGKKLKAHSILYNPANEIEHQQKNITIAKNTRNNQLDTDTNKSKIFFLSLAWPSPLLFNGVNS